MRYRRWQRSRHRKAVAEIIGAILLLGLTIVAGVILWSFRIYVTSPAPTVQFLIRSGSSSPVWGDPTDCQPNGYVLSDYPLSSSEYQAWANAWNSECYPPYVSGNFSQMNVTEIVVSGISSSSALLLSDVDMYFVCNNATSLGGTTVLVNGSLASMTWFPGVTSEPASDAPSLGYCGNFDAGDWSGIPGLTPAYGTLYNRLDFFDPLVPGSLYLSDGDTLTVYLHFGGFPLTFLCVAADLGQYSIYTPTSTYCKSPYTPGHIELDYDDYHGAPPWCFLSVSACTIFITYTGSPSTLLAKIPVASLAPPS